MPWQVVLVLPAAPHASARQLASMQQWLCRKRAVLQRLLLLVKGYAANGDGHPDIRGARALLASLSGSGLRALAIGLHSYGTKSGAGLAIGGWLGSVQLAQMRHLEIDSGSPMDNSVGAACLSRLTNLQSLSLSCSWLEYGGLGQPDQPPFLLPSLTSLEPAAAWYLPRLDTATRLQRLAVLNSGCDTGYPFDTAGLEAATGLTALLLEGCEGLVFISPALGIYGIRVRWM